MKAHPLTLTTSHKASFVSLEEKVVNLGKLTRLRPPHKDECCVTARGWRGREETRPPRHADSFAPAYRPERPLRLRAGGLQRRAPARRTAADRHAARCASRGLCSGVRPSTLYALGGCVGKHDAEPLDRDGPFAAGLRLPANGRTS